MTKEQVDDLPFINCGLCKRKMEKVSRSISFPNSWTIMQTETWECPMCKQGMTHTERNRSKKVLC